MLWGRPGYNPNLANDQLIRILQTRFPRIEAKELFIAGSQHPKSTRSRRDSIGALSISNGTSKPAIEELTQAAEYWKLYMNTAMSQYKNPLWTNRVGHVDWKQLYQEVLHDIDIAKAK